MDFALLAEVRVGDEQRLGEEGTALWKVGSERFDWERTVVLGSAIGAMARTLDDSVAYATQREAFGKRSLATRCSPTSWPT